jgi:Effector-associated domain 11
MNNISKLVWDAISSDKIEEAISLLKAFIANSPISAEVAIHSAKYSDLAKQIRLGTLSLEQINVEKNKLRLALLDLAEELEKEISIETQTNAQTPTSKQPQQIHYGSGDNIAGNKIINK